MEYNGVQINDMTNVGPVHHMITGNPCFHIGMDGGCGLNCSVYLAGQCSEPEENLEYETRPDIRRLYDMPAVGEIVDSQIDRLRAVVYNAFKRHCAELHGCDFEVCRVPACLEARELEREHWEALYPGVPTIYEEEVAID